MSQPTYQCRKCGTAAYTKNQPFPNDMGKCTNNFGHIWVKCA